MLQSCVSGLRKEDSKSSNARDAGKGALKVGAFMHLVLGLNHAFRCGTAESNLMLQRAYHGIPTASTKGVHPVIARLQVNKRLQNMMRASCV